MQKQEWQELFYTYDIEGNFVKLGGKYGQLFPNNQDPNKIFDVEAFDGTVLTKCLIVSFDNGMTVSAITQEEQIIPLQHETKLRANPDIDIQQELLKLFYKKVEQNRREKIIERLKTKERIERLKTKLGELEREMDSVIRELDDLQLKQLCETLRDDLKERFKNGQVLTREPIIHCR